jgi:hypothetical protein
MIQFHLGLKNKVLVEEFGAAAALPEMRQLMKPSQ